MKKLKICKEIIDNKKEVLEFLQEAYKKALSKYSGDIPDKNVLLQLSDEWEMSKKIYFKLGKRLRARYWIFNIKENIALIMKSIKEVPKFNTIRVMNKKHYSSAGYISSNYMEIGLLYPVTKDIKDYFTDGIIVIKGKLLKNYNYNFCKKINKEKLFKILNAETRPVKFIRYECVEHKEIVAKFPFPIPGINRKEYEQRESIPYIVFKDKKGKRYCYNQYKFNVLKYYYKDINYRVSNEGILIGYENKKPIVAIASLKNLWDKEND